MCPGVRDRAAKIAAVKKVRSGTGRAMPITTSVLFVCDDNAAMSLTAESVLRSLGAGKFRACSAGIAPAAQPHPLLLDFLRERQMPASGLRPKSWREFLLPEAPRLDF